MQIDSITLMEFLKKKFYLTFQSTIMTKKQLQKECGKVINETHKRAGLGERLKEKNISLLGDLLLFAQVLLDKIATGENIAFNSLIYQKTISFYSTQMKHYA